MVKSVINDIYNLENLVDENINQVKYEEQEKLKEYKIFCENEWGKMKKSLILKKEEVLNKSRKHASEELKDVIKDAENELMQLNQIVTEKAVIEKIVGNLIKVNS